MGQLAENTELHWLSPSEVATRFVAFPDAVARTGEIAACCDAALPDGRPIWPSLKLPAGQSPDEALAELAAAGLRRRYGEGSGVRNSGSGINNQQSAVSSQGSASDLQHPASSIPHPASSFQVFSPARLAHELVAIATHGFAPLFLIVADTVRFARANGIPVSTCGSVANSLVAYCTGYHDCRSD